MKFIEHYLKAARDIILLARVHRRQGAKTITASATESRRRHTHEDVRSTRQRRGLFGIEAAVIILFSMSNRDETGKVEQVKDKI